MLSSFFSGVGMLLRGFGFWRRAPGVMVLGLVPAAIVFALVVAALVALGFAMPGFVGWLTPFDDNWPEPWPSLIAAAIGAITFAGAIVLAAVTFTAVTLAVGDPFYEKVWRAAELDLNLGRGGDVPESGAGFWVAVRSGLALIGLGILTALGVAAAGAIPLVGAVLGPVLGVIFSGRLLAMELSSRAFQARDIPAAVQRTLRHSIRWQLLGFGVATQLMFMIPFGAVFTMPAAVAGSTILARTALDRATPATASAATSQLQ